MKVIRVLFACLEKLKYPCQTWLDNITAIDHSHQTNMIGFDKTEIYHFAFPLILGETSDLH